MSPLVTVDAEWLIERVARRVVELLDQRGQGDQDEELVERAEALIERHQEALFVGPEASPAVNVASGWLGADIPDPPRQRSTSRASYRKTSRRRPSADDDEARRLEEAWWRT